MRPGALKSAALNSEILAMERSFIILLVAVLFEVVGTSALKQTQGFTKLAPSLLVFVAYAVTFALMSISMKTLPIGLVYAVWSGLGTACIAIIGWLFFREPLTSWAILGISMIVGGVVVLHTVGTRDASKTPLAPTSSTSTAD